MRLYLHDPDSAQLFNGTSDLLTVIDLTVEIYYNFTQITGFDYEY